MLFLTYLSLYVYLRKTYRSWGMLHLALKSDMNTETVNSGNRRVSRMFCSSTRIPLGHPNIAGAISRYKTVVAQPSSLGILWHTHIWDFHAGIFRAFHRTSCAVSQQSSPASASTFWRSTRFCTAWHYQSVIKRHQVSLGLNFNQLPHEAIDELNATTIALIHVHFACQEKRAFVLKWSRFYEFSFSLKFRFVSVSSAFYISLYPR